MKKILVIIFLLVLLMGYAVYDFLKHSPSELYGKALRGEIHSSWYISKDLRPLMVAQDLKIIGPNIESTHLWKKIKLGAFEFPMPYRHPLYRVIPVFPTQDNEDFGIAFWDNNENEILSIVIEPATQFARTKPSSQFYDIPLVDYLLSRYTLSDIWRDLFSKDVPPKMSSLNDAIKDLFLLEQRSSFFPKEMKSFGQIEMKPEIKFYDLEPRDKDFYEEKFLLVSGSEVLSFKLIWKKDDVSSQKFRDYILKEFTLSEKLTDSGAHTYAEFKNMKMADKIDEIGFIQLYSAWSQNSSNRFWVREIIYYLEMNPNLGNVLKRAYAYAFFKYQKIFAHHKDIYVDIGDEFTIQRKIELEDKRYMKERLEMDEYIPPPEKDMSHLLREKLRRAREEFKQKKHYRIN